MRAIVVAGTHSGVGKTSLSVGLMLALKARGLTVQPFKVGPDFLDPMWHVAATGRPSINLDSFMMNKQQLLAAFHRHAGSADIAVVEGVMGLFDSRDGSSEEGSTAQVAKWLGAPVLLVVDCWCMARSVAALVKGYAEFDSDLQLNGLLLNKVGSTAHATWLKEALEAAVKLQQLNHPVEVLGCIPQDGHIAVPERYLGLSMPHEQQQQQQQDWQARLCALITQHVDLDRLMQAAVSLTEQQPSTPGTSSPAGSSQGPGCQAPAQAVAATGMCEHSQAGDALPSSSSSSSCTNSCDRTYRCRIAVARDEAFCFYYEDNLALLEAAGAQLVFFSPLARDAALPEGVDAVYLGGGYPERHAEVLASNVALLQQLRSFAAAGGVVYAECGGLLYLSQGLWQGSSKGSSSSMGEMKKEDVQQQQQDAKEKENVAEQQAQRLVPLAGVLPFTTRMGQMKMGYVEVTVLPDNPLFPAGSSVRGQLYHFSEVVKQQEREDVTQQAPAAAGRCGSGGDSTSSEASGNSRSGGGGSSSSSAGLRHTYELLPVVPGAVAALEGYSLDNVLASYVHLHWGGCPQLAEAFVAKCSSRRYNSSSSSSLMSCQEAAADTAGSSSSSHSATVSCCCCCAAAGPCSSGSYRSGKSDRIVSLLPSGSEILCALGCGDRLVGVSGFCDFRPELCSKAVAVRSLIDVGSMSSDEIETAMQGFKAAGESPFSINVELLQQQRPGLLLTQDACGTCDADCSLVCKAMQTAGLSPKSTQVLVLHPRTLAQVLDSITTIGRAAGAEQQAQQLVQQLRQRLAAVAAAVTAACPAAAAQLNRCTAAAAAPCEQLYVGSRSALQEQPLGMTHQAGLQQQHGDSDAAQQGGLPGTSDVQAVPRVLSLEGLNPLVLGGQWLPDMKLAAGCDDASGQQPGADPARMTWQQMLDCAPDVLVLSPCSRSPAAAMPDVERLVNQPGFLQLPAVQAGRVFVVDHAWFSRPGPLLVDGVELLASLVHGVGDSWGDPVAVRSADKDGLVLRLECSAADGGDSSGAGDAAESVIRWLSHHF